MNPDIELQAQIREDQYHEFMAMCHEKYPEIIRQIKFRANQERAKYILLYLYHKSKTEGKTKVFCTRRELIYHYKCDIEIENLTRYITLLVTKKYITRKPRKARNGAVIGNDYIVKL